ncbi:hypothetical protein [Lysobacter gummosus]|uniref:hypothetical protein n=1 Tax=Lysobacter gummosus TaxID=262324 RepID=UPI003626244E
MHTACGRLSPYRTSPAPACAIENLKPPTHRSDDRLTWHASPLRTPRLRSPRPQWRIARRPHLFACNAPCPGSDQDHEGRPRPAEYGPPRHRWFKGVSAPRRRSHAAGAAFAKLSSMPAQSRRSISTTSEAL